MNAWARIGATKRRDEILTELAAIHAAFPELGAGNNKKDTKPTMPENQAAKRKFSARGKKAISEGMRKYWARRKALAAKTGRKAGKVVPIQRNGTDG